MNGVWVTPPSKVAPGLWVGYGWVMGRSWVGHGWDEMGWGVDISCVGLVWFSLIRFGHSGFSGYPGYHNPGGYLLIISYPGYNDSANKCNDGNAGIMAKT